MKKYDETSINEILKKTLDEQLNLKWDLGFSKETIQILFESMALYLSEVKDKNKVKALTLIDVKGNFNMGAYVEYHENDEDGKGSWTITFTFNQSDINKEWDVDNISSPFPGHVISDLAVGKYGISFKVVNGISYVTDIMCAAARSIKQYLKANIQNDPSFELESYFTATAEQDGETIYYTITPGEILKQHLKDDTANEQQKIA